MLDAVKFVLAAIVISILYGIAHDLVTANVCVQYFTVYHPQIVDSESPWVMALLWGVIATWWMGLILGTCAAAANWLGRAPSLAWKELAKRFAWIAVWLWVSAMAILWLTYGLFDSGENGRLWAVGITHGFSSLAASMAGVGFVIWIVRRRAQAITLRR